MVRKYTSVVDVQDIQALADEFVAKYGYTLLCTCPTIGTEPLPTKKEELKSDSLIDFMLWLRATRGE